MPSLLTLLSRFPPLFVKPILATKPACTTEFFCTENHHAFLPDGRCGQAARATGPGILPGAKGFALTAVAALALVFSGTIQADVLIQEIVSREVSLTIASTEAPPPVTGFLMTLSPTGDRVALEWTSYNPWAVKDAPPTRWLSALDALVAP